MGCGIRRKQKRKKSLSVIRGTEQHFLIQSDRKISSHEKTWEAGGKEAFGLCSALSSEIKPHSVNRFHSFAD